MDNPNFTFPDGRRKRARKEEKELKKISCLFYNFVYGLSDNNHLCASEERLSTESSTLGRGNSVS